MTADETLTSELRRLLTWTSQMIDDVDLMPRTLPLNERTYLRQLCTLWLSEITAPQCTEQNRLAIGNLAVILSEQTRHVIFIVFIQIHTKSKLIYSKNFLQKF